MTSRRTAFALLTLMIALVARAADFKALVPPVGPPPERLVALAASVGTSDGSTVRAALDQLALDGPREALQDPTGAELRAAIEGALRRSTPKDLVVLSLRAPVAAREGRLSLLGADGAPAMTIQALKAEVEQARASRAIVVLGLDGAAPSSADRALIRTIASLHRGLLVVDGAGLAAPGAGCPGSSAAACTLSGALGAGADANHDRVLSGEEITAALTAQARSHDPTAQSHGDADAEFHLPLKQTRKPPSTVSSPAAPALESIEICLYAEGEPVPMDHVFHTGDHFSLSVTVPETGWLALGNRGTSGALAAIYPSRDGDSNHVTAGVTRWIPWADEGGLVLNGPPGVEDLALVWSRDEIEEALVMDILERAAPDSGLPTSSAVAESRNVRTKDIQREELHQEASCSRLTVARDQDVWSVVLKVVHEAR